MKRVLKIKTLIILWSLLFVLYSNQNYAQLNWVNYNTSNSGLIFNSISCLTTDKTGNVWMGLGTGAQAYGIMKFDGNTWTLFDTSNSGLLSNRISSLCVDTNNVLWMATFQGLAKYDGTNWIIFDTSNSGIIADNLSYVKVDELNRIWISSYFNGISIFDGSSWINHSSVDWPFPNDCYTTITFDNSNKAWFGFDCSGGIAVLNLTDSIWTFYNTSNSALPSNYISSIGQDLSGNIWAGISLGFSGLAKFDGNNWIAHTPFQLSSTWVTYDAITVDAVNNLWIGTRGDGLVEYDGTNSTSYGYPLPDTGISTGVQPVDIDIYNRIWFGEVYTGLWTADLNIGINENKLEKDGIKIHPNPVSNNLTIEISAFTKEKKYLSIYNVLGEKVIKENFYSKKHSVNVSDLAKGIYIAEVRSEKNILRRKFVKE